MGVGSGKTQVKDRKSAVYWGKSFSNSQKRLQTRAKAESTEDYMYVFKWDLRRDILIAFLQSDDRFYGWRETTDAEYLQT